MRPKLSVLLAAMGLLAISCGSSTPPLHDRLSGTKFKVTAFSDETVCEGRRTNNGGNWVGATLSFSSDLATDGTGFKGEISKPAGAASFTWKVVETEIRGTKSSTLEIRNSPFNCIEWKVDHFRRFFPREVEEIEIVCEKTESKGCVRTVTIKGDLLSS